MQFRTDEKDRFEIDHMMDFKMVFVYIEAIDLILDFLSISYIMDTEHMF